MDNPDRIMKMASAFFESCVLFASSDLGVFSKLAELGEADAKTLSNALKLDHRAARLILDACVGLEFARKKWRDLSQYGGEYGISCTRIS